MPTVETIYEHGSAKAMIRRSGRFYQPVIRKHPGGAYIYRSVSSRRAALELIHAEIAKAIKSKAEHPEWCGSYYDWPAALAG